jgi:hypothetical protein
MRLPDDDIDRPEFLVLQDDDRFHCILHTGDVALPDGTTMVLVIFVVRRAAGGATCASSTYSSTKTARPAGP